MIEIISFWISQKSHSSWRAVLFFSFFILFWWCGKALTEFFCRIELETWFRIKIGHASMSYNEQIRIEGVPISTLPYITLPSHVAWHCASVEKLFRDIFCFWCCCCWSQFQVDFHILDLISTSNFEFGYYGQKPKPIVQSNFLGFTHSTQRSALIQMILNFRFFTEVSSMRIWIF